MHSDHSAKQLLIVGINGSLRAGSFTRMALDIALQGATELGAHTHIIDLRDYDLPFCDGRKDQRTYPPDVQRLRTELQQAHGAIWATPEYHGSFSGVLKNALDLMGFAEFEGKMIGLLGLAGGQLGAINALNGLRTIGRSLHAWVIPEQVSLAQAWREFNADGTMKNIDLAERVRELGRQVARFSYLHTSAEVQEFLQAWETAPFNPGGRSS